MAGGAYIRISGGNIEIGAPGKVSIKGANHAFSGPAKIGVNMQSMPSADLHCITFTVQDAQGNIQRNIPYVIKDGKGQMLKGITDNKGRTQQVHTSNPNGLSVHVDHDAMGNHLDE